LLLQAPADPVLHSLAGLATGIDPVRTGLGRLVTTAVTIGVGVAVVSCGSAGALTSSGTTTWWQGRGVSMCGSPAVYRINAGKVELLGDCAGVLLVPGVHVTVAPGSEIDIHIAQEGSGPAGTQLVPIYPTPSSTDGTVLVATRVADGGSTESFVAVGAGTAEIETNGLCSVSATSPNVDALCPVMEVGVS
jgi:hypothetical protein